MTWYNKRDKSWGPDPDDFFVLLVINLGLVTVFAKLLGLWLPGPFAWALTTVSWLVGAVSAVRGYRRKDPSFRFRPPPAEVLEQRRKDPRS